MSGGEEARATWLAFSFSPQEMQVASNFMPQNIQELLDAEDYQEVYERGYNLLTFTHLDMIDLPTLLNEAVNKYIAKFYPGLLEQSE